jgi:hypothetical protein
MTLVLDKKFRRIELLRELLTNQRNPFDSHGKTLLKGLTETEAYTPAAT